MSSFPLNTSMAYTALRVFSDGAVVNISTGTIWSSTDPAVFTIDSTGLAKSGSLGTAKVGATLFGITAYSDSSSVYAATLKTIKITPSGGQIATTTSKALFAQGIFSDGTSRDITENVIWSSSANTVATADPTGLVQGNFPGTTLITATLQGVSASTELKVSNASLTSVALTPPSSTMAFSTVRQFNLTGTFTDGTTQILNDEAVWSADNPAHVDVAQNGVVLGVSPGSGTVSAQRGRYVASAFVNVTNATLSSMAFASAPSASLSVSRSSSR